MPITSNIFDQPMTGKSTTEDITVASSPTVDDNYAECDYDRDVTPLYQAIEDKAWYAVNQFLHSGYWPESLFPDPICPQEQSRTWVTRFETRRDGSKKIRWSQLPIHVAVVFGAPSVVIEKLIEHFPSGVRCTDDHKMLPLHLAFRHGASDACLALFLEAFPGAINCKGHKGILPVDCAKDSPNPQRAMIIQTILQRNENAWEKKRAGNHLRELYQMKESLQMKTKKVQILENAMTEIKERGVVTERELELTRHDLKTMQEKQVETKSLEEEEEEKKAILALMNKLTALEDATKDLVEKEIMAESDLRNAIGELEKIKKGKGFQRLSAKNEKYTQELRAVESKEEFVNLTSSASSGGSKRSELPMVDMMKKQVAPQTNNLLPPMYPH